MYVCRKCRKIPYLTGTLGRENIRNRVQKTYVTETRFKHSKLCGANLQTASKGVDNDISASTKIVYSSCDVPFFEMNDHLQNHKPDEKKYAKVHEKVR